MSKSLRKILKLKPKAQTYLSNFELEVAYY
jgi:hypothetical protein